MFDGIAGYQAMVFAYLIGVFAVLYLIFRQ